MILTLFAVFALSTRYLLNKNSKSVNTNQTLLAFDGQSGECGCGGCGCGGGGK